MSTHAELAAENAELRARLEAAEETLRAIRSGEADALVMGEGVYTLKGAETPYRVLIEQMYEGAAMLMDDGTVLYANRRLAELLRIPLQELIGTSLRRFVVPAELSVFDTRLSEGRQCSSNGEFTLQRRDGSAVPVAISFSVVYELDARPICVTVTDLTEHKRAGGALREQEQDFRTLAETVPQIVWATRPDGWNIFFNQQWVDYTGLTLAESYGHGWNTPFHPDDKQRAWEAWQRATHHNEPYSLDCRLRRADGVYRWWLIRGAPVRNAKGEIQKWFGTCTDIEDIKRAELALQQAHDTLEQRVTERTAQLSESEVRLRLLGDNLPESAVYQYAHEIDGSVRFVYVSAGIERLNGVRVEDVLRDAGALHRQILPEYLERLIQAEADSARESSDFDMEVPMRRPDGQVRWMHLRSRPRRLPTGRVIWDGVQTDVTERKLAEAARKQAEEALRDNARLLNDLIDGCSPSAIFLKDRDGRFLTINAPLEKMLGMSRGELKGKTDYDLFPKQVADLYRAHDTEVIATAASIQVEEEADLPDGHHFFLANKFPLVAANGHLYGVGAISHDITERKRAEEALRVAFDRLYSILASMYGSILLVGDEGKVEFANQSFCDLFDLKAPPKDLIGLTSNDMIGRIKSGYAQPEAAVLRIREIVSRGQPVKGEEVAMRDGGTCLRDFIPIGREGKPQGRLWHHIDITERKQTEEALRLSEAKFAQSFASNPAAIALSRLEDGLMLDVNDTWVALTGFSREEAMGRSARTMHIWPSAEAAERFVAKLKEQGSLRGWEQEFCKKSGELYVAQLSAQVLIVRGEQVVLSTLVDITERKRAEEALRASNAELARFNQAMVGRELRMIELKQEVNALCAQLGEAPHYAIGFEIADNPPPA